MHALYGPRRPATASRVPAFNREKMAEIPGFGSSGLHPVTSDIIGRPAAENPALGANTGLSVADVFSNMGGLKQSAAIKTMLDEPMVRNAVLRDGKEIGWGRATNVEAVLITMTGTVRNPPCKSCSDGSGPFTTCVTHDRFGKGSCGGCHYNSDGSRCTFHARRTQQQSPHAPGARRTRRVEVQVNLPSISLNTQAGFQPVPGLTPPPKRRSTSKRFGHRQMGSSNRKDTIDDVLEDGGTAVPGQTHPQYLAEISHIQGIIPQPAPRASQYRLPASIAQVMRDAFVPNNMTLAELRRMVDIHQAIADTYRKAGDMLVEQISRGGAKTFSTRLSRFGGLYGVRSTLT